MDAPNITRNRTIMNTQKKLIIMDFDGVITDSLEVVYQVVSQAFATVGIPLSLDAYKKFFLINPKLAEKQLTSDEKKFIDVQKYIHQNIPIRYKKVKIFQPMIEIIQKLHASAELAIVSSSQSEVIIEKLKKYSLDQYFSQILGADKEVSKIDKIKSCMDKSGIEKKSVYFISDTVGDILEGKKMGIKTIAVSWGFHNKETLLGATPDKILTEPDELLTYIIK
ncbi:MAG: putative phosphatase [Parcubacteria group bacterium GW2011_GWA2_38_13]|nr:MAG: putative phosphatase [Parcubacteria group bacterium GW2011_GWA2_38_13]